MAASGVEFTKPYGPWHFASAAELASWNPRATLGLADDAGACWGWVEVDEAGDGDPRRHSQALLESVRGPKTRTDVDEYVLYVGHTAHRWETEESPGDPAGLTQGVRTTTLVEGKRRYVVWAHARGTDYRRRRHCLDDITSSFSLRPPSEP